MDATATVLPLLDEAVALRNRAPDEVQPSEGAPVRMYEFEFTGTAREYFGIWIVNILVSVLTLGIYSAWAKVRTKRYFYGHTVLDGTSFDYLARPTQILKGRLLALAALIAYLTLSHLTLWTDAVVWLVLVPALMPWVVVRALSFSRRYSSYRNIRFGFDGSKREAFGVFVLLPVAAVVSLGLLYPHLACRQRRYQVEHSRLGRTPFAFDGTTSGYCRIYAGALAVAVAVLAGATGLGVVIAAVASALFGLSDEPLLAVGITLLAALAVYAYVSARTESYAWSRTRVAEDRFRLDLQATTLAWIYLTNALTIALTLGLAIPWAKVRLARYRLSRLSLAAVASLDRHLAAPEEETAAAGEEVGEALGLGLGL